MEDNTYPLCISMTYVTKNKNRVFIFLLYRKQLILS